MDSKHALKSKTLWVNLIVAAASFHPKAKEVLSADQVMMFLGVINMGLRLITKDKVILLD